MVSDLDTYRAANALIKKHGDEASLVAAMRADKMLTVGDMEGKATWLRILRAIDEITKKRPSDHDRVQ